MGEQLIDEIARMTQLPGSRYGLLYQTPEGEFRLSGEDGLTGSAENRYVISTTQLRELMSELGFTPQMVAEDRGIAAQLASVVAEIRYPVLGKRA